MVLWIGAIVHGEGWIGEGFCFPTLSQETRQDGAPVVRIRTKKQILRDAQDDGRYGWKADPFDRSLFQERDDSMDA